jgi:hypothetical protein
MASNFSRSFVGRIEPAERGDDVLARLQDAGDDGEASAKIGL